MAIYDLLSKRRANANRSGVTDVYQYDDIPPIVRRQFQQIVSESLGATVSRGYGLDENPAWLMVFQVFCREKGYTRLANQDNAGSQIIAYLESCDTDDWLDICELICLAINRIIRENDWEFRGAWGSTDQIEIAIDEINYRLKQGLVGYQFEYPHLVRIDSQFVHAEVVKPALSLLNAPGFSGPQEEFTTAHQHYRAGEYRQAVAMAANALESTFKAVFDQKDWPYKRGARISDLARVARDNGLWPDYLDNSFEQLVATLQSGPPKIRDNAASHGQGAEAREVPGYVAAYALHLAASKIVFIVEAAGGA